MLPSCACCGSRAGDGGRSSPKPADDSPTSPFRYIAVTQLGATQKHGESERLKAAVGIPQLRDPQARCKINIQPLHTVRWHMQGSTVSTKGWYLSNHSPFARASKQLKLRRRGHGRTALFRTPTCGSLDDKMPLKIRKYLFAGERRRFFNGTCTSSSYNCCRRAGCLAAGLQGPWSNHWARPACCQNPKVSPFAAENPTSLIRGSFGGGKVLHSHARGRPASAE